MSIPYRTRQNLRKAGLVTLIVLAVLALLIQIEDFKDSGLKKLLRIAADGKVDQNEAKEYAEAVAQLLELVKRAYALGYAKE